jgi:predicted nuclease with TOPRIM domain
MTMKTTTEDPAREAIVRRLTECEGRIELMQSRINLLAEELTDAQKVKRKAQNEATHLRVHLDANFPGWDGTEREDSELPTP